VKSVILCRLDVLYDPRPIADRPAVFPHPPPRNGRLATNGLHGCLHKKDFFMKDIFFFDAMLTPKIITLLYWAGLLGVIVCGVAAMFGMFGMGLWSGLAMLIGGLIGVRLWCELLIVMFKINENLKTVAARQ